MSFCKNVKFTQIFSLIFFSESEWVFSQNHVKLLFPREPQARNDPRRFRRMMNQVIDGSFQDKLGQLLTIMELSISELAWIFNILFSPGLVHLSWNDPQKLKLLIKTRMLLFLNHRVTHKRRIGDDCTEFILSVSLLWFLATVNLFLSLLNHLICY